MDVINRFALKNKEKLIFRNLLLIENILQTKKHMLNGNYRLVQLLRVYLNMLKYHTNQLMKDAR